MVGATTVGEALLEWWWGKIRAERDVGGMSLGTKALNKGLTIKAARCANGKA